MRFIYLQHIPYRHLSEDFAARFPESVVTTPYFERSGADGSCTPTSAQDSTRRCMPPAPASTRWG